jgi:uncharacterized damage-inducible protein DinB
MTEKDSLLTIHQREYQTTHRVISAYPANQLSYRPHERSRSAQELAFTLAHEEQLFVQATKGVFDPSIFAAAPPSTLKEILQALETNAQQVAKAIGAAPEEELNKVMNFAGHEMRRIDMAWAVLFDLIHHRGQFSVYVRMAGGKVPSIYGPSADEPTTHTVTAGAQS